MSVDERSTERGDYVRGMEFLVGVVQELSLARSLDAVMAIVRSAARMLTGADGATFVLAENGYCYYADEEAISPLWKGSRFPMSTCISGWAMLNRQPAIIEDIYADERIPHEAYRPTFVKSLAMVPIRTVDPIGAIGNYWAEQRRPSETQVQLLQALADSTAVAMENVQIYAELEQRVAERTGELDKAVHSLREFVAVAAHDLRSPIAAVHMAAQLLERPLSDEKRQEMVQVIERQTEQMGRLTDDLLTLCVIDAGQIEVHTHTIDVRQALEQAAADVADRARIDIEAGERLRAHADPLHLQRIIGNLLGNSIKYGAEPIRLTASRNDGVVDISVLDGGAGVPPDLVPRLFDRFTRAEGAAGKEGVGLGLSIVRELARVNGGDVVYEQPEASGACFRVTLPSLPPA